MGVTKILRLLIIFQILEGLNRKENDISKLNK